jgi:hypothetical protein
MILQGSEDACRDRQPSPADVLCLIEVADSSYDRDAGEKLAAGTYAAPLIVPADGSLLLHVGTGQKVSAPLIELLP